MKAKHILALEVCSDSSRVSKPMLLMMPLTTASCFSISIPPFFACHANVVQSEPCQQKHALISSSRNSDSMLLLLSLGVTKGNPCIVQQSCMQSILAFMMQHTTDRRLSRKRHAHLLIGWLLLSLLQCGQLLLHFLYICSLLQAGIFGICAGGFNYCVNVSHSLHNMQHIRGAHQDSLHINIRRCCGN